jgi:ketosteroid isomerase-like protein
MSEQDLEVVRRLNEAFNAAPEKRETWLAYYHPDQEFHAPPEWPEKSVYRGHEGIAELAEAWFGSFDEYRWDMEELIDAGHCAVGLVYHRGRMGSQWIERKIGAVFRVRDGKVIRVDCFFSWDEALESAGFEEKPAS